MRSPFRYRGPVVIEIGQVKHFDRGYGFLRVLDSYGNPSGSDIFFHTVDRRAVEMSTEPAQWNQPFFEPLKDEAPGPQLDDLLVFVRGTREDGKPRAIAWAPLQNWRDAEQLLSQSRQLFRVRTTYHPRYQNSHFVEDQPQGAVIWSGTDILGASLLFPVSPDNQRDSLTSWYHSTGWWAANYSWEVLVQRDTSQAWTSCADPRVPDCCLPTSLLPLGWQQTPTCEHRVSE